MPEQPDREPDFTHLPRATPLDETLAYQLEDDDLAKGPGGGGGQVAIAADGDGD
jgi:hypothetical protein